VKKLSHLPIFVDPSHGTGHWEYVSAMAKAGLAAGADGPHHRGAQHNPGRGPGPTAHSRSKADQGSRSSWPSSGPLAPGCWGGPYDHRAQVRDQRRRRGRGVSVASPRWGYGPHVIRGEFKTIVAAVGGGAGAGPDLRLLEAMETVESVMAGAAGPFKARPAARLRRDSTEVRIKRGSRLGGRDVVVMAGPLPSVESQAQVARGGRRGQGVGPPRVPAGRRLPSRAPRPTPSRGLKEEGFALPWRRARKRTGLAGGHRGPRERRAWRWWRSTATSSRSGARNIQKLHACCAGWGRSASPVLLKRGMAHQHPGVPALGRVHPLRRQSERDPLRARGIRTFEDRHPLSRSISNAVPVAEEGSATSRSWWIPSHGTGHWDLVAPMAKGAVACGGRRG